VFAKNAQAEIQRPLELERTVFIFIAEYSFQDCVFLFYVLLVLQVRANGEHYLLAAGVESTDCTKNAEALNPLFLAVESHQSSARCVRRRPRSRATLQ